MALALADLGKTLLIGSGAVGTELRRLGGAMPDPVELLNLRAPDLVKAVHAAYVDAGSQVLVTNTFAANPILLEEAAAGVACREVNEAGVALARAAAAGAPCGVWASVGPLSLGLRHDDYGHAQLLDAYSRQCGALAGADAIVLETFVDPREARAALAAALATGLPVVFQVGNTGRRAGGGWTGMDALLSEAEAAGARAVGTNCGHPDEIAEVAAHILARTALPVTASPNAGHPTIERGRVRYDLSPDDFLRVAERLAGLGVAVIGGCCGTGPEHIRRIGPALRGRAVPRRAAEAPAAAEAPRALPERRPAENRVRRLMKSGRFLVSAEIRADKGRDLDGICRGGAELAAAGADLLDVPDNPGASVGRDAAVTAARLQESTGLPAVCHMAATQANLLRVHSGLIGCWDLGVRGILAVTGDSPSLGPLGAMARPVSDLKSSVELLRLVRRMREEGRTLNGEPIEDAPDFCAGCATGQPTAQQAAWLRRKIEAGAEFVFSQPVFDEDGFRRLHEAAGGLGARLFVGLMPLVSRRSAQFLGAGRIPGIRVPPAVVEGISRYERADDQRRHGLEQACRLARAVAAQAAGAYVIAPFGRTCYADAAEVVRALAGARKGCGPRQ